MTGHTDRCQSLAPDVLEQIVDRHGRRPDSSDPSVRFPLIGFRGTATGDSGDPVDVRIADLSLHGIGLHVAGREPRVGEVLVIRGGGLEDVGWTCEVVRVTPIESDLWQVGARFLEVPGPGPA